MYTKTSKVILSVIMIMLLFGGCNGNSDSNTITTSTTTSLSGVAQKGAFFKNSNVSLCKLDDKMVCTNEKIETKVSDDKGSYEFKTLPWSGLSRLSVSGYYFNEETGHKSLSPAVITAIVNIQSNIQQKSNTNILTDLRAKRMKKLVDEGKSQKNADKKSQEDIKQLFNLNSDDFTALDLVDFSAGKASINAELLRLSAAIAKSSNPVGYLEELMKIYNEGGLAAVLDSTLYKKLMYDIENVDMNRTLTTLGITSNVNNSDALSTLRIHPFARAMMSTQNNKQVIIKLFGTEFTTEMPSISMSVEGTPISIVSKNVADDNKSITLDMNESSNCRDMNLTFTLEYMDLKDVSNPLRTNTILYANPIVMCDSGNNNATPIKVPDNQRPIAIIGMNYGEIEVNEVNITAYAGQRVNGLESSYSHDRDPYPFGGITHCQFEDNNHVVIKEANSNACDLYNEVFDVAGVYDYTLTVTDKAGATDTSVAHITVLGNHSPEVSLTPNTNQAISVGDTLELNATANDADVNDELNLQWMYQKVGTSTQYGAGSSTHFSHIFNEAGEYNISVIARDNHNAEAVASIMVSVNPVVVPINHTPTVRISPDGNKNLSVGDSLILKSISTDGDGDSLTTSWKLKNITANEFTSVPTYGATGFKYTFETEGTYLVVVEVEDDSGSMSDTNITVNVTKPTVTPITMTLEDINISIAVKGSKTEQTNGSSDVLDVAYTAPEHGTVAYFKIGNEVPAFKYTSTDCFMGQDSFIYKSGSEYGRVHVTITSPSTLNPLSETKTLLNTETISGEYLRAKSADESVQITTDAHGGSASLTVVGNEIMNYNYDPDDTFVGNDYFEYNVSESIDECSYSKVGRIDFVVSQYIAQKRAISTCRDPYTIGTELYVTDGTLSGTTLLKDLTPGIYSSGTAGTTGFVNLDETRKVGNIQYFVGKYSAGETQAYELYETNATTEGTFVHDINTHNEFSGQYLYGSSHPGYFARIDNDLFFIASDSTYDRYGMYKANGKSVVRVANNVTYKPVKIGDSVYYSTSKDNNVSIYKLNNEHNSSALVDSFMKDTSAGETRILTGLDDKFILTEYHDNLLSYILYAKKVGETPQKLLTYEMKFRKFFKYNSKIYFVTLNNTESSSQDGITHIVESNGTVDGTQVVHTQNGDIQEMALLNDKLYFIAKMDVASEDSIVDYNLYVLDLESNNASLVAELSRGKDTDIAPHRGMENMSVVDGKLIFQTVNEETVDGKKAYYELLWVSNGTALGTHSILRRDRAGISDQKANLKDMFELNGAYYFQDDLGRLYKTDFTESGTSTILDYVCDIYPDSFSFVNVTDANLSTYYEANMTVEGITYPQTKLSIENGEYSLDNGLTWSTEATTIANGQKIKVRHMSSDKYDTSVETTLYVGQNYGIFSSTTKTETLATPNQFTFTDVTNVEVNTIQTANITVSGINAEVPLSITGGEYSLDSGSSWNIQNTTVTNNQVVYVRHTSSTSNETKVDTVLTVGGVSDTFSSTTRAASVGEDTITVGSLMWEDTEHVVGTANYVTWSEAQSYCSNLDLEGYTDWRLPHSTMNSDGNSEVKSIRIATSENEDNTIVEGFNPVYQLDRIATWTDEFVENGSYVAMIFQYSIDNGDAFSENSAEINVRCVRDTE